MDAAGSIAVSLSRRTITKLNLNNLFSRFDFQGDIDEAPNSNPGGITLRFQRPASVYVPTDSSFRLKLPTVFPVHFLSCMTSKLSAITCPAISCPVLFQWAPSAPLTTVPCTSALFTLESTSVNKRILWS